MGLGDILFGRKKLKGPARDRLFALTTSAVTLGVECGLQPAGAGAVVFKPLSAGDFARVEQDGYQGAEDEESQAGNQKLQPGKFEEVDHHDVLTSKALFRPDSLRIRSVSSTMVTFSASSLEGMDFGCPACIPRRNCGT